MYSSRLPQFRFRPKSTLRIAVEIFVAAATAYFVARYCLSLSFQQGRLSLPSDYDDVVYLTSAQQWLNGTSEHGFFGNFAGLLNQHAPVATGIAALSFAFAGPNDWPPYAANGVLLGMTLWAVMRYLTYEGLPLLAACLLTLCLVDIPFFEQAVTEFRPDPFAGVVTAFSVLLLFHKPVFCLAKAQQFGLGLLFGLALLMKPSAFLASGFIIAVAVVFSYAGFILERDLPLRQQMIPILRSLGLFLLGAMLVFGPYLLAQGEEILAYVYLALFTLADVNDYNGTFLQQLAFYSTGPGGGVALGYWFWIGVVTMLLRLAMTLHTTRSRLPTLCAGYATLMAIYLVLTLTAVKHFFLGSMFFAAFSFFMVRDWAWLWPRLSVSVEGLRFSYAFVILFMLIGMQRMFFPQAVLVTDYIDENYRAAVGDATLNVWQLAKDKAAGTNSPGTAAPITILVNTANPVRTQAIALQANRERLDIRFADGLYIRTTDEFLALAGKADIIVVARPVNDPYPGSRLGDDLQAAMAQDNRFRSLQPLLDGFVQLYERTRETPSERH